MKTKKITNFAPKKVMSRFINPFTDFGFKKLFGENASKPMLISFLNSVLPPKNKIKNLSFENVEQQGDFKYERKAVFDIFCKGSKNEKFIIELQRVPQNYFKDRTLFYSSLAIKNQGKVGGWDFNLDPVYCIAILNFSIKDNKGKSSEDQVKHIVHLKDEFNDIFYKKYQLIYLEMPNFKKELKDLKTLQDKWLYFIKNLESLSDIPQLFKADPMFEEAFMKAEYVNLNSKERFEYDQSLKVFRDMYSALKTQFEEGLIKGKKIGIQKGKIEGKIEGTLELQTEGIIKALKNGKLTIKEIADVFEVSNEFVLKIKKMKLL